MIFTYLYSYLLINAYKYLFYFPKNLSSRLLFKIAYLSKHLNIELLFSPFSHGFHYSFYFSTFKYLLNRIISSFSLASFIKQNPPKALFLPLEGTIF